jgi:hypothetical protein
LLSGIPYAYAATAPEIGLIVTAVQTNMTFFEPARKWRVPLIGAVGRGSVQVVD